MPSSSESSRANRPPQVPCLDSEPGVVTRAGDTASRLAWVQMSGRGRQSDYIAPAGVAMQELASRVGRPSVGHMILAVRGSIARLSPPLDLVDDGIPLTTSRDPREIPGPGQSPIQYPYIGCFFFGLGPLCTVARPGGPEEPKRHAALSPSVRSDVLAILPMFCTFVLAY